jgi:hypothetical protein
MIRNAYFGGRCEVFGNAYDDELIYHYDFNSMYTNMLRLEYPYGEFYKKRDVSEIKYGFYNVSVASDLPLPILPYKNKDGKLIFPNGNFSGTY